MEGVVLLREGREAEAVRQELAGEGARLSPMYPGAQDPEGRRWFLLAADEPQLGAAIARLQTHPDVEAAYLKPAGESPG